MRYTINLGEYSNDKTLEDLQSNILRHAKQDFKPLALHLTKNDSHNSSIIVNIKSIWKKYQSVLYVCEIEERLPKKLEKASEQVVKNCFAVQGNVLCVIIHKPLYNKENRFEKNVFFSHLNNPTSRQHIVNEIKTLESFVLSGEDDKLELWERQILVQKIMPCAEQYAFEFEGI